MYSMIYYILIILLATHKKCKKKMNYYGELQR